MSCMTGLAHYEKTMLSRGPSELRSMKAVRARSGRGHVNLLSPLEQSRALPECPPAALAVVMLAIAAQCIEG